MRINHLLEPLLRGGQNTQQWVGCLLLYGLFVGAGFSIALFHLFFGLLLLFALGRFLVNLLHRPQKKEWLFFVIFKLYSLPFFLPVLVILAGFVSAYFWGFFTLERSNSLNIQPFFAEMRNLWRFLLLFLLFFILPLSWLRPLFVGLFGVVFLQAVLGVWQYYNAGAPMFTPDFWGYGPNNMHPIYAGDTFVAMRYEAWGTAGFHLFYAQILLLSFFPWLVAYPARSKGLASQLIWVLGLVLLGAGLFFSFARSSWVGLVVGLVFCVLCYAFWAIKPGWLHQKKTKITLGVSFFAASCLLFLVVFFTISPKFAEHPLQKRILSIVQLESNKDRLLMWQAALNVLQESPVFGMGTASLRPISQAYQEIEQEQNYRFINEAATGVHNFYLQVWLEYGLLGLVGFLWLVGKPCWQFFVSAVACFLMPLQSSKRTTAAHRLNYLFWLEFGLVSSFVAIAVVCFFENVPFVGASKNLFWLFLALLYRLQEQRKIEQGV